MAKTIRKIIEIAIVSLFVSGSTFYISLGNETLVNQFITPTVVSVVKEKIGKDGSPPEADVKEQISKLKKKVSAIEAQVNGTRTQVNSMETQVNGIKAILEPETESSIDVKLFWSERNEDKDLLVLNVENPKIDRLLQNGCFYTLTAQNQISLRLKSRLDRGMLDESDKKTTDSLGRIHNDQVGQLFKDSKWRGSGRAKVQLTQGSCDEESRKLG